MTDEKVAIPTNRSSQPAKEIDRSTGLWCNFEGQTTRWTVGRPVRHVGPSCRPVSSPSRTRWTVSRPVRHVDLSYRPVSSPIRTRWTIGRPAGYVGPSCGPVSNPVRPARRSPPRISLPNSSTAESTVLNTSYFKDTIVKQLQVL